MTNKGKQRGFCLQPRDRAILQSLSTFRFLTSVHVQRLHFAGCSLRMAQRRLTGLYAHGLVRRCRLPLPIGAQAKERGGSAYALSSTGVETLRDHGVTGDLRHGMPWKGVGPAALLHHLTTVDLFVAITIALQARPDVTVVTEPELTFRQRIQERKNQGRPVGRLLVPDGAVTLCMNGRASTFYLETVRADVKGGMRRFRERLERYASLHHAGVFRKLYGHERLRAVVWLASSPARAETLRGAAQGLRHGRQLFWFGSYGDGARGAPQSSLTPERILDARFRTVDDTQIGFFS